MTLLRGVRGSRLLHLEGLTGDSLCGAATSYPVANLYDKALLCWGCSDLAGVDAIDYPFAGIEEQVAALLARMPYDAYLRSSHWRWIREVALDFYGRSCALCGSTRRIEVHHRTYERRGRELLSDLTVLCDDCHARFHGKAA